MKKFLALCIVLWSLHQVVSAQVTAVTPNSAYQGQSLHTTITSASLFLSGSSPQGNIQDILLKNATDSVFAVSDSTNVVNTNTATAFLNIPGTLATGIYDLVVRIYNSVTQSFSDFSLLNGFTVNSAAATVSGTAYIDANTNGVKDAGETGIQGYTVNLTTAGNSAITDASGDYSIGTVIGTDIVNLTQPLDDIYLPSGPLSISLNVASGANAGNDFGMILDRYLSSMTSDSAVQGQSLTCTINSRKVFTSDSIVGITLSNGTIINGFAMAIADTNTATVSFNVPGTATIGQYNLLVTVKSRLNNNVRVFTLNNAFRVIAPPTISGTMYNDLNGNGAKDAGEPGIQGYTIRLNSAGATATTDASGNYTLNALPGVDTVNLVRTVDDIYINTTPAAIAGTVSYAPVTGYDFGVKLDRYLIAMSPDSAILTQTLTCTFSSRRVFQQDTMVRISLDQGAYSIIGTARTIIDTNTGRATFYVPSNIPLGKYNVNVVVRSLQTGTQKTFTLDSAFTVVTAPSISGTVFNDVNRNGVKDAGEAPLANYKVQIGLAGNYTYSDAAGHYTISTVPGLDTVHLVQAADDIYAPTSPASVIIPMSASSVTGQDFGLVLNRFLISISPNTANVAQSVSTVILDSNVTKNSTLVSVVLQNQYTSLIYASANAIADSTHINASFYIPVYAMGGKYDLVVTVRNLISNTIRSYTLDTAFKIIGPVGFISGYAFEDANANGVKDPGEALQANKYIYLNGSGYNYSTSTDSNGYYSFSSVPNGTYSLVIYNPYQYYYNCGSGSLVYTPASYSVSINNDTLANKNFGSNQPNPANYNLYIHPGWSYANPGFQRQYWIFYGNSSSNVSPNAILTYVYDSTLTFVSSDRTPTSINTTTHTITWNVGAVPANSWLGGPGVLGFYMHVPTSDSAGRILISTFTISPTNDCYTSDNTVVDITPVTSSRDPNEKHANPHSQLIYNNDSVITYTINFQNTGNASTHFVIVVDTLDPSLDPKTILPLEGCAPYRFENNLGVLRFSFDNLALTDSATDEVHSHGFISFTAKLKPNLALGTVIKNTGNIYFDYNQAVNTNTTVNTISRALSVKNIASLDKVKVSPNPFSESTTISFSNVSHDDYSLAIFDLQGNLVSTLQTSDAQFEIERNQMASGVYIYRLTNLKTKASLQGKLSAQ